MATYISKTGRIYPVFKLSECNNLTKECIRKHLDILNNGSIQSKMRAIDTDRTLYSTRAQGSKTILLFIETDSNNNIIGRFAVDLAK